VEPCVCERSVDERALLDGICDILDDWEKLAVVFEGDIRKGMDDDVVVVCCGDDDGRLRGRIRRNVLPVRPLIIILCVMGW